MQEDLLLLRMFGGKISSMQPRRFKVRLTEEAKFAYREISSKADLKAVNGIIDVLDTVPGVGRLYDPLYDAAKPPFEILVAYAGSYGVYYVVDEGKDEVHVYFIEDQRGDPLKRFGK